jgi:hypothetical protein
MKKWLLGLVREKEDGVALLLVMVMLTAGSLIIVPSLNYITTGVKTGQMYEEKLNGLYAADAGAEDGLWRLTNGVASAFPYSYQLTDVNGMTVDVIINAVTTVGGVDVGVSGVHDEYLDITKTVTYDSGIYDYVMTFTNSGTGNVKVEMIFIDLPPHVAYVPGSTGGQLYNGDPTVIGDANTGQTIFWNFVPPQPTIPEGVSRQHTFQLSGPEGVSGVEGHGAVRASRQDVGTVWDVDSNPYSITAEARDASDTVVCTIRVGLWEGAQTSISGWQIDP